MTRVAKDQVTDRPPLDRDLSALAVGKGARARTSDTDPIVVVRQATGRRLQGAKGRSETAIRHKLTRSPCPLAGGGMALLPLRYGSAGYVRQCSGGKARR
ncbi:hypothetical protein ATO9_19660 [Pseudooceanicola atlanticus]|uniref:Uncharacterized protein n=1 Tax=Pseudooceanicola atlanticus TaxID=1461694 RepID=A0A0A0E9T1_9RHOB|nr:hypothetical protein ATO9_19660 [Pseudooceanicola atlanticus]